MKHIKDFEKFNEGIGMRAFSKGASVVIMSILALKNLIKLNFKTIKGILQFTPHFMKFIDIMDLVRDHDTDVDYEEYVLENFPDDYPISFAAICRSPNDQEYEREAMKRIYQKRFKRDVVQDIQSINNFIQEALEKEKNKEKSKKYKEDNKDTLETIKSITSIFIPTVRQQTKTVAELKALPRDNRRGGFQQRLLDMQVRANELVEDYPEIDPLENEIPRF